MTFANQLGSSRKEDSLLSPAQKLTSKLIVPELISKSMNSYQNLENLTLSPKIMTGKRGTGMQDNILSNSQNTFSGKNISRSSQEIFGKIFKQKTCRNSEQ